MGVHGAGHLIAVLFLKISYMLYILWSYILLPTDWCCTEYMGLNVGAWCCMGGHGGTWSCMWVHGGACAIHTNIWCCMGVHGAEWIRRCCMG